MRRFATAAFAAVLCVALVHAETAVENSVETQFQLDLHVPDAALAALLPSGWTSNVSAQGPAKDMNMRVKSRSGQPATTLPPVEACVYE